MAPRTRNKEDPRREVVDERPTVADLEGESSFATLARKLWLNKKTAKVKVKPEVLKTEIWDVLEKEDFPFKSLLVLENLQILERYGRPCVPLLAPLLTWKTVTFGRDILKTHPTFKSCSLS
jgi:intron-binding protein aquarius